MPPTIKRPGLSTGQKHHIRVASRDWTGVLRRLVDDKEGTFKAHLPLRPRGPQVVIDPFVLQAAQCNVRGTVFSPGRLLDPTSELKAWIDGTEVTGISSEGAFGAVVKLHAGHDQIHVRAKDLTQREGRGYVGTWIPGDTAPPEPPSEPPPPTTQRIRMRLEDEDGEALSHLPYELTCAGEKFAGITDDNGYLTHQVSASATTGELTFWLDEDKSGESYTWPLKIADIAQPPTSGGGAASVGRGAAAVWCGTLGGFVRAAQAAPDDEELPPPQPIQRPARYGSVRAEVQRFIINPPMRGEGLTADLVLKDDQDAEVGRCTVKLEKTPLGTATEWVCITAADPSADPAPPAIEGKLIRVASVKHTLEIKVGEVLIGNRPMRFSGWDPSTPPTPMSKVERDAPVELALGGVVGGAFDEPEQLGLRWMVDADADDVLLPSSSTAEQDAGLAGAADEHAAGLASEEPVDLTEQKAPAPLGWAALGVEGLAQEDPFPEEQAHAVLTYQEAPSADAPEAEDFALSPRKLRVVWHDTDEWSCHPDQLIAVLKEGTADDALKELTKKVGMEVAGTVRRDGSILLEAKEPVCLDELLAKLDVLKAESCVEAATINAVGASSSEDVSSVRVPSLLRSPTPNPGHPTQPGGVQPFELLALRHHFQMRTLPAQQLVEKLRAAVTGPQPNVLMGVCDSGFGLGQPDSLGPDFDPSRLPMGGRNVNSLGTVRTMQSAWMRETVTNGHGTLVAHCMAGGGAPFLGANSVAPALSVTAPLNLRNDPWSLGVCPTAQLLPIRIADPTGSASAFGMMSAVRFCFNQTGVRVVNLSYGSTYTPADIANGFKTTDATIFRPSLNKARDVGGILVIAAGNDGSPLRRRFPGFFGPTAARTATSHPAVIVTPTSQTLVTTHRLGSAFPLTFPSPWGSFETRTLRAGGAWVASFGPEASVSAPGDALCLRLSSLTAPRRRSQVDSGAGTSFAAPLVAGLFGLMHVADQLVNPGLNRTGTDANDFANKLIALMQYTAHRDAPLFTAAEATAQFSNVLGHGRIDVWAAILSTLNGGPMQSATAPHAHISGNIGAFVSGTTVKYYGLELDTRAYHARPVFVNADTGLAEDAVDSFGQDPAIDATDPTRPVWSYLLRDGGGKDELLPCTEHPGPEGWYTTQLSIARERLQAYTHLLLRRPGAPTSHGLVASEQVGNVYYGLPLAPLLNHDTSDPAIAPFHVDARHFIFKARTDEWDRRLRVTFDRVELGVTAAVGDWSLTGTAGSESTGAQTVRGSGVRPLVLAGPDWSKVVVVPVGGGGLTIGLSGTGPNGEAVGPLTVTFTGQTTPADPSSLPYGIGKRRFTSGPLVLHLTIAHEPALERRWKAELLNVRCTGEIESGDYRFAVEVDAVRSAWTAIQASSQSEADDRANKLHEALLRRVFLFFNDPDQEEIFRILEGASSLERRALEGRFRALYGHEWRSLREAIRDKLGGADRDRALRALDDPRALSTDAISVESTWLPGQGPRVAFRWQDRSSLRGDAAEDRPDKATLAARSATGECTLVAGPFTATVKISSV